MAGSCWAALFLAVPALDRQPSRAGSVCAGRRRIDCAACECQRRAAMSDQIAARDPGGRATCSNRCMPPIRMPRIQRDPGPEYLVLFLRVMAAISLIKGLYHWAAVCGVGADGGWRFRGAYLAWRTATVFFAVLDLVAAVGLWLAAPWGAVVWLTSVVSMAVVDLFFPQVYGGSLHRDRRDDVARRLSVARDLRRARAAGVMRPARKPQPKSRPKSCRSSAPS